MLPEDIIARSLALREVSGRRADGPHGLAPAGQTGFRHRNSRSSGKKPGEVESTSKFAISFEKDEKSGELKLVRKKP